MHFVAVRRILEKEKVQLKYRRTYKKKAKMPYTRIMDHSAVAELVKEQFGSEHAAVNPLILKREIGQRFHKVYTVQKRCREMKN